MEQALTDYLLAQVGVTDVVGTRLTWSTRTAGAALPAIVLHMIDSVPVDSDEGDSNLSQSRIQADCLGNTYAAARTAATALRECVSGKSFERRGVKFDAFTESEQADFEKAETKGSAAAGVHRISVDFLIWHAI